MTVLMIGDIGVLAGMFHIGDEAMFEAARDELGARGVSVLGISSAPSESAARYGIPAIGRLGFVGLDRPAARARAGLLCQAAAGEATLDADDPAQEVLAHLESATGVLNAGGGNLASRWPVHIDERATLAAMARARGLPVVVTGQTFGPDLDGSDIDILAEMLRAAALVSVREPDSAALVRGWGTTPELGVDDASFLGLDPIPTPAGDESAPEPGGVLVSLSGWFAGRPADVVEARIAGLADAAAATVGPVSFHAHFGPVDPEAPPAGDASLHERVRARMTQSSRVIPTGDSSGAARLARSASLLITSRYHPAVFAAPAGVPVMGLSADRYTRIKLGGVLGHWSQDAVVDMDDLADAPGHLERLWARRAHVAAAAADRMPRHRDAARQWWDRVAVTLGG